MQLVRRHADGMRDLLDFGLGAPVLGDVGDRAAHDGVVVIGAHAAMLRSGRRSGDNMAVSGVMSMPAT